VQLALDLFNPISGGGAIGAVREAVPELQEVIPEAEGRLGVAGHLAQMIMNIRAAGYEDYTMDRVREAGFTIQSPHPRAGQPVKNVEELTNAQMRELETVFPGFTAELQKRLDVSARRETPWAVTELERQAGEKALLDKVTKTVEKNLTAPPGSGDYRPRAAKAAINKARDIYYNQLYGTIWDKELGRFTGGLYDTADFYTEPAEKGTLAHLRWQYRDIFNRARDPLTGEVDFEIFNGEVDKLWERLDLEDTLALLSDIRDVERKFPKEAQTLLNARRYAGALRFPIDGVMVNYWEIQDLPGVREEISAESGASLAVIEEYLQASFGEQEDMRKDDVFVRIQESLNKAANLKGFLGERRWDFMEQAQAEVGAAWFLAMGAAGNNYLRDSTPNGGMVGVLKKYGDWSQVDKLDYEAMYMALIASR
jgi:hypothetical protein